MPPLNQPRAKPPAAERPVQQRAVAALLAALLSLTGVLALGDPQRGIYLVAYALLAGAVAMWLAVTSLTRARRGRTARPHGSAAATAIAGVGIVFSMMLLLAFIILGRQMSTYGQCLSEAGTTTAQQSCQAQFNRAVNKEISTLRTANGG